jgi:DNA polymerase III subunit delta'
MLSPLENPNLYGHEAAEAQILRLIEQKKLPHALLISGPEGIGKATFAFRIAKYLLAGPATASEPVMGLFGPEPTENTPQGLASDPEHPALRRMIAGSHGDFLLVQPEFDEKKKTSVDTIFIEQVREVVGFMRQTHSEGDWRVVIIDPAEAMNTAAANALLKVLEEPPSGTLLMLVSHQPGRLLPTIKSRCRKIVLSPPAEEHCQKIVGATIPADELHALLALTQGSPGRALRWDTQNALTLYREWLEALARPQPSTRQKIVTEAAKAGPEGWAAARALLLQLLYRLSLFTTEPEGFTPLNTEETAAFEAMLARQPLDTWARLWERAEALLPQVHSLTLDRQQVILSLLAEAASGGKAAA